MSHQVRHFYEFGPFRLDSDKPCLWRNGEPVALTPKAVETLRVLIQQNGKLVQREDLMSAIWPDTFVEDGNLNFNISMLRKALGTDETGGQYIQTIPKHGYRFQAEVREVMDEPATLVVEKHTRARLVIEERELLEGAEYERAAGQLPTTVGSSKTKRRYIAAIALASLVVVAVAWFLVDRLVIEHGTEAAAPRVQSIAVLPLKPLGDEEADRTLSLGLTDTLIMRLGSLRSIRVRSIPAGTFDGNGEQDLIELGRKLKVDTVLEGSIQRTDKRIRVNVRLLRASDGTQLWSGSFDENETDLFKLQDQLSLQVTESLGSSLNPKERELIAKRYTENREAFHAYWRGRFFLEKRNPVKAIPEFQQAMDLDPNYVLAYTGLADAYSSQANVTSGADSELYDKARALVDAALRLDPNLADAHTSLGRLKYSHNWDWNGAEDSFKRAIELDPNNVNAHQFYGRLLATLGRYDQAIAEIQIARELDPRSADLAVPLFAILEKRGEFDEALKVLQTSLDMDKESEIAQRAIGKLYLLKGEYSKVIDLARVHFPNLKEPNFAWTSMLATAYHKIGNEANSKEMQARLKDLAVKDSKALYFLVMHYSEIGRIDEAIAALQKCLELREERMMWTRDEPRFAALKDDPRFQAILRKMKLVS